LQCLTEIGGLQTGGPGQLNTYDEQLVKMFTEVLASISNIIPLDMDLKTTYPQSNSRDQEFIQNLALFLCNFYSMHLPASLSFPSPWPLLAVLTPSRSSSRTSRTEISSPTATSTLSESPRLMTARSSRSA
jgi:hypothetical protein